MNIGIYLLDREKDGFFMGEVRIDNEVSGETFSALKELEEVVFLKQIRHQI